MGRRFVALMSTVLVLTVAVAARVRATPVPQGNGWTLPDDAKTTKNPLTVDANVIAAGKALFKDKCQRCHGPGGLGDGPDADPDVQEDMNLTIAQRAANNPDGVVFYKVWNGRKKPKMPAFKDDLTKDQIWTIVSFVQTLRKPS
jgi:mono/diheme cytochrome c family protein